MSFPFRDDEIRQTEDGPEQFCRSCQRNGEPEIDCWWPVTADYFPVMKPGRTRIVQYKRQCKACVEQARRSIASYVPPKRANSDKELYQSSCGFSDGTSNIDPMIFTNPRTYA